MYDVKSLSINELKDLVETVNREIDFRRQNDVNKAIDDFEHAFKRLRELRIDIQYCPIGWDEDNAVHLRNWDELSFN